MITLTKILRKRKGLLASNSHLESKRNISPPQLVEKGINMMHTLFNGSDRNTIEERQYSYCPIAHIYIISMVSGRYIKDQIIIATLVRQTSFS